MIVSRNYIKKHKLKPSREFIIKGGKNNGFILSIVPKECVKDKPDDVDVFGTQVEINGKGQFEMIPLNDPGIDKNIKHDLIMVNKKQPIKNKTFVFDSDSESDSFDSDLDDSFSDDFLEPETRDDLSADHQLVVGSSGAGKTHHTVQFCKNYKKIFPKNKLFLISPLADNKDLLRLNPIRINIKNHQKAFKNFCDEDEKMSMGMCKNSLIIFDDIDSTLSNDKIIGPGLKQFVSDVKTTGRHYNITSVTVMHKNVMGKDQWLANESSDIVIFPGSCNYKTLLGNIGIRGKLYDEIMTQPSRCVIIHKNHPQFFASNSRIKILPVV